MLLLPVLLYQGFDDVIQRHSKRQQPVQPVPTGQRIVTYRIRTAEGVQEFQNGFPTRRLPVSHPDFIGPQQYGEPLTHEERYGWNPDEAREEYGFGGKDGTPRFKGYFG
jgi:hypothetical protein